MAKPSTKKFRHHYLLDFPYKFKVHATGLEPTSTVKLKYSDEATLTWDNPKHYVRVVPANPAHQGTIEFTTSPHLVATFKPARRPFVGGDGDLTITVTNSEGDDTDSTTISTTYQEL